MREPKRLLVVTVFAIAMAWVESAVVLYLRTMINRLDPYQPVPLPRFSGIETAEIIREVATMVMLAAVGWLAGWSGRTRFAYSVFAFGVWDIFYYLFLKPLTGWPRSLLDWDILFLIPLPWWGPVLAPVLIAVLMITFGVLVSQFEREANAPWPGWQTGLACLVGIALALYVFMADALRVVDQGETALRELLPTRFRWAWFLIALALMAAPVMEVARQTRRRQSEKPMSRIGCRPISPIPP